MIFNSISKELTNNQLRKTQYRPNDYQPTYQIPTRMTTNQSQNSHYEPSAKTSALSHMNQKIIDNLEYLRYKDQHRQKQLQMSRVSHRSNRSHHSTHSLRSHHSIKSSPKVHLPVQSRYSIKTTPQEHYFPTTTSVIRPEFENWKRPNIQPQHQPVVQTNFREFLRKPITFEEYSQKYGNPKVNEKKPEKDSSKIPFTMSSKAYQSLVGPNEHFKTESQFRQAKEEFFPDKHSVTNPVNRQWTNSFGDKFPQVSQRSQVKAYQEPQNSLKVTGRQNESPPELVSPLPQQKKRKDGLIVAVALVALGLLLFILQTIK